MKEDKLIKLLESLGVIKSTFKKGGVKPHSSGINKGKTKGRVVGKPLVSYSTIANKPDLKFKRNKGSTVIKGIRESKYAVQPEQISNIIPEQISNIIKPSHTGFVTDDSDGLISPNTVQPLQAQMPVASVAHLSIGGSGGGGVHSHLAPILSNEQIKPETIIPDYTPVKSLEESIKLTKKGIPRKPRAKKVKLIVTE